MLNKLAKICDETRVKHFDTLPTRKEEAFNFQPISPIQRGHKIMDDMRAKMRILDESDKPRSKDQRFIHHEIMSAMSRFIYGPELYNNEVLVKTYNKFDSFHHGVIFTAPRRNGKTRSIVMIVAIVMLCVPNAEICVVAQTARASGADSGLYAQVKSLLGDKFNVTSFDKSNKETLILKMGVNDERKLSCYSGGSRHG